MNERTPNPKHESPEIDLSPERREDQPEPTPESVEAQKELERARGVLHDSFNTLLRSAMGGTYAHGGEEGFSGDAASLYVLTSIKNKKGEDSFNFHRRQMARGWL